MQPMSIAALLLAATTFALIVLGGIVHATGASLACPDWPTCHGTFFPELAGGVLFEHSHRVLALWVSLITVGLALWAHVSSRATTRELRLTRALVVLLGMQVLLGASTVRYGLPAALSTAHLATALLFFAASLGLGHGLLERRDTGRGYRRSTRTWARAALAATFLQILAGGVVRHTGAALSCTGFPLCEGLSWPDSGRTLPLVHMLHRLMALVLVVIVAGSCAAVWRDPGARRGPPGVLALGSAVLIAAQPLLGIWSVASRLAPAVVTLHLAAGALLFGALVLLELELMLDPALRDRAELDRAPARRPRARSAPSASPSR